MLRCVDDQVFRLLLNRFVPGHYPIQPHQEGAIPRSNWRNPTPPPPLGQTNLRQMSIGLSLELQNGQAGQHSGHWSPFEVGQETKKR